MKRKSYGSAIDRRDADSPGIVWMLPKERSVSRRNQELVDASLLRAFALAITPRLEGFGVTLSPA